MKLSGLQMIGIGFLVAIGLWLSATIYETYHELRWGGAASTGHHLLQKHDYKHAIDRLEYSLRVAGPSDRTYFTYLYLGEAYRCQGNFDRAIAEYRIIIANRDPMVLKGIKLAIAHDKTPLL